MGKKQKERLNKILNKEAFSEKIYSDEDWSESEKLQKYISKLECGEYRRTQRLCNRTFCYNRAIFNRIQAFNYSESKEFINYQANIRGEKRGEFLEEFENFLTKLKEVQIPTDLSNYFSIVHRLKSKEMEGQGVKILKKVFIIHGHNLEMKTDVQLFINRCGLDDIVLHERPSKNRTIIQKLLEESKEACFAIALFSEDDKQKNGKVRARQMSYLSLAFF